MKRPTLLMSLALTLSGMHSATLVARECFVDPGTGIRACCMDCGDAAPARGERSERSSERPQPQAEPQEAAAPPALVEISRDRVSESALLRRLVVRAESLPVGPAAMPTRILAVPAGERYVGANATPAVELRMPTGYTPPSSIPLENLRRAAAILRAMPAQPPAACKNPYDPCNEDTRFLGRQAGKALEGRPDEPLQVVVPNGSAANVAARRKEADEWVAKAASAGERLNELQTRRDAIERRLAPLKREYDAGRAGRGAEQEKLENEYRGVVEQEKKTQVELGQAQKRVATILVEVVQ